MALATTTLEAAREAVALAVQDMPGTTVSAGTDGVKRLDYAIRAAGNEFVRRTFCTRGQGTKAATVDSDTLDTSSITDMDPSRIFRCTATEPASGRVYPVEVGDFRDVQVDATKRDLWLQFPYVGLVDTQYRPHKLGFRTATSAIIWPTPGVAWSFIFDYWVPFTSWTIGTATPASVTLNIPDDMIDGVLWYGVPAYFENPNPANRYQETSRIRFERHVAQCRGRYGQTHSIQSNALDYS